LVNLVPGGGSQFIWRTNTSGNCFSASGGTASWVKLTRTGNSFASYSSSNGTTWTQVGTTQTISMAGSATLGLIVCSHNNSVLNTSTFTNVTATP
jgi:regulation of enolase protein 1 (concanavalin A-like superfamily)